MPNIVQPKDWVSRAVDPDLHIRQRNDFLGHHLLLIAKATLDMADAITASTSYDLDNMAQEALTTVAEGITAAASLFEMSASESHMRAVLDDYALGWADSVIDAAEELDGA